MGYGLTDSPLGLVARMYDYNCGEPERLLTKDEMLNDITLYWLTNTAISSARLYWENVVRAAPFTEAATLALPAASASGYSCLLSQACDATAKPGRFNDAHDGSH